MSLSGSAVSSSKARIITQVAGEVVKTRNLDSAIKKFGQSLTPAERNALKNLTIDELKALASVDAKLAPLGLSALY